MMFKKPLFILALPAFVLASCGAKKQDVVFSLEGKLHDVYSGRVVLYQATDLSRKRYDVVDTLSIADDSTFSASYNLEPHYYMLSVYDSIKVPFIADSGQHIVIRFPAKGEYNVSGSPDTELFERYETFRTDVLKATVYPLRRRLYELLDKKDPADAKWIEELGERVTQAEANYRDTLFYAVRDMGTSIAVYPTMLRWNGDKHMAFYERLATQFAEKHRGLAVAQLISEKVRVLKQVSVGGAVADISAVDTSGVRTSLYENLGTYTLIDFWGSWCAPCRAESAHLRSLFDAYRSSGFAIFGFAIEEKKDNWIKAIVKDRRTWVNVSTLDGYANEVAAEYAITALPKNFLVDDKGVILAKDIYGKELDDMLEGLFPTTQSGL